MVSPTSRYVPLNTKLSYKQWSGLQALLKEKKKILKKCKYGMVEDTLWFMEQVEYLQELKKNNLPYILGSLLNGKQYETS